MTIKILRRAFLFIMMLTMVLSILPGLAQDTGTMEMITVSRPGGEVVYPQLAGYANSFVQDTINQTIMDEGGIQGHLDAMAAFSEVMPGNLKVTYQALILKSSNSHDLLSILIEASGNISPGPPSHRYTPLVFSLVTGQKISCDQIFAQCGQARENIEDSLEERLGDEISNYLNTADLYPFPIERFLLTETGISFFYPEKGMVWLSGKSAYIHFHYNELEGLLSDAEDMPLKALHLFTTLNPGEYSRPSIESAASIGRLPGIPVKLGESLRDTLDTYPLLHDPEGFVAGEKYQLEDDLFRGTWVLSKDDQTVTGLFSRRMNLFGLQTGKAAEAEIRGTLGEPAGSVSLNAEAAQLYGVPAGTMMEYAFADTALKLFLDKDQVLIAIWLDKT